MTPTLRVDEEVFRALQGKATPFVDSPNDVLRRLLGLRSASGKQRKARGGGSSRRGSDSYTPQSTFRLPILKSLDQRGGNARMAEVLEDVQKELVLKAGDFESTQSGAVLWENRAQWERLAMIKGGLLRASSPHGVWEISESGRELLS